jgi:hypothetical protein
MTRQILSKYKLCLHCNKEVLIPPYRFEKFKFCSRSCAYHYKEKHEKVHLNCVICNKEFSVIPHRQKTAKYCSRKCYNKSLIGRGSVKHECLHCHKEFWDSPSKKRKYCSILCTGKSQKETFKPKFSTVRKAMIARGLLVKCNRCGFDEFPQILGVHHKDRNRNNNEMDNLEVLCPNCHSMEHMKHTPHGFKE